MGKTKKGKGTKIMAIADQSGKPISVYSDSATPHEVKLVEKTLENRLIEKLPDNLIGDKAYDSDELDQNPLNEYGITFIVLTVKIVAKLKMEDVCADTGGDGKLRDCFLGCTIFVIFEA